jgi:hypothetical protein
VDRAVAALAGEDPTTTNTTAGVGGQGAVTGGIPGPDVTPGRGGEREEGGEEEEEEVSVLGGGWALMGG